MRTLLVYDNASTPYLPIFQSLATRANLSVVSTSSPIDSLGSLLALADESIVSAILVARESLLPHVISDDPKPTLSAWRGSMLKFRIPILILAPLQHLVSVPYGQFLLTSDLKKLHQLSYQPPLFAFETIDSYSGYQRLLTDASSCLIGSLDIETRSYPRSLEDYSDSADFDVECDFDTLITCISYTLLLPDLSFRTYVIPFFDFRGPHFLTTEELMEAYSVMRKVNAMDFPKVMQNGMYDTIHLLRYHAPPRNWIFDTMGLAHGAYAELPKGLEFLSSLYLPDHRAWKHSADEASKRKDDQLYWKYNAQDTYRTLRIFLAMIFGALPSYAWKNYSMLFPLVFPFLAAGLDGLKTNNEKRRELLRSKQHQQAQALSDLRTMFNDPDFNPASPKQVKYYLYSVWGAKDPHIGKKKTASGGKVKMVEGTDKKNLAEASQQHPILNKICTTLLSHRDASKACSTYYSFAQRNARLLYSIDPFGTETGRSSCKSSSLWCGAQVQNIPSYAKKMLVADEGWVIVEIDNSQSEARCTAYLSKEPALKEALETPGKDFYKTLGFLFFQIPYDEVTKEFRNRVIKKIVHGTNYMMGWNTFVENATMDVIYLAASWLKIEIIPDEEKKKESKTRMTVKTFATMLLDSYHVPFPRVRRWYQETQKSISSTKKLVSPLGYTRIFFSDPAKNHNALMGAVAHGPQNLSVAILNRQLLRLWERECLNGSGDVRFLAQIHDSVLLQVRVSALDKIESLRSSMETTIKVNGWDLRIPTDVKCGQVWGEELSVEEMKERLKEKLGCR